jgi:hypothetical protein
MVITPSIPSYQELIRLNKNNGSVDGGDQGVLNFGLCPDWHHNPTQMNVDSDPMAYPQHTTSPLSPSTKSIDSLLINSIVSQNSNNNSNNNNKDNNHSYIPPCGRLPWLYNVYASQFDHYSQVRRQYNLSPPLIAHFMSVTKPWVTLEYEYIQNYNINTMSDKIRNDLQTQAPVHAKWRQLYQKASGDKTVTKNKVLSQFLQQQ